MWLRGTLQTKVNVGIENLSKPDTPGRWGGGVRGVAAHGTDTTPALLGGITHPHRAKRILGDSQVREKSEAKFFQKVCNLNTQILFPPEGFGIPPQFTAE